MVGKQLLFVIVVIGFEVLFINVDDKMRGHRVGQSGTRRVGEKNKEELGKYGNILTLVVVLIAIEQEKRWKLITEL